VEDVSPLSRGTYLSIEFLAEVIGVFLLSGAFLGFGAAWNLRSMTFGGGVDRRIFGLLTCSTKRA